MRLRPEAKRVWIAAGAILASLVALAAVIGVAVGRNGSPLENKADREHPIVTVPRIASRDGRRVLRLDAEAVRRAGIRSEPLVPAPQAEAILAFATVVQIETLARRKSSLAVVEAQVQAGRARVAASEAEFERSRRLFEQDQDVSAGQLQAAQATYLADRASLAAAEAQSEAERTDTLLQWGPALGTALIDHDAAARGLVEQLLARRRVLLQVAVPEDFGPGPVPSQGRLLLDDRAGPILRYVSAAPRADPRLAGRVAYFSAPSSPALLPGASFRARLPTGRSFDAAQIPAAALVWWQGRAWVFTRSRSGGYDFERREIPFDRAEDRPVLEAPLEAGTELVVQGAQVLLSEELRAENFSTDVGGR